MGRNTRINKQPEMERVCAQGRPDLHGEIERGPEGSGVWILGQERHLRFRENGIEIWTPQASVT